MEEDRKGRRTQPCKARQIKEKDINGVGSDINGRAKGERVDERRRRMEEWEEMFNHSGDERILEGHDIMSPQNQLNNSSSLG